MDWWIVKQLRAMILTDLSDFVPQGYFESEAEKFKLHHGIKNADHFSRELRWGYLAGKLGKRLFFESTAIMSARQVSASEVLMNLGMLACAEAAQGVTTQLSKDAEVKGVSDGNSGAVAEQLGNQHIPTLSNNVKGALEQYLRYLTPLEAEPFLPLLESVPYVIGDLIERSLSGSDLRLMDSLHLSVQNIDQFKNIDFLWSPSPMEFNQLKKIPEQQVKELFCRLLGEAVVPKDWGGEECDIFSSNLSVDGKKCSAAFLLKGPANFHEMTMMDCGKNGDQIYRLFRTPADVFIIQHCHKITPPVRKTIEVFALALAQSSRSCLYTLIDGYDTARILHSNGIL